METLTTVSQQPSETRNALPAESCHWYDKQGQPRYTIIGKNGKERSTTLRDAREHGWLPSVTEILNVSSKPGLQKWKLQQMLHAALTLPRIESETEDQYAERIITDSETQSKKAMERGTELHAAIEQWIRGEDYDVEKFIDHIAKLDITLRQYGINLKYSNGKAEHSFASPLGYGGKLDWHNDEIVCDFKTKQKIEDGKQLAWPEHCWQLAAYSTGLFKSKINAVYGPLASKRHINVFIGVEDCQVRIHEWSPQDAEKGWEVFSHLLAVWKIIKNYNP